jgi:hypothetical protein
MISLIISSTTLGLLLSNQLKHKINVCKELSAMCDMLCLDLNYSVTPITQLVNKVISDERLKDLNFISNDFVKDNLKINSCLSESENKELSSFLYSLGKSDVASQIKLINGFKEYINSHEAEYSELYAKKSKLYISFGFFGAVVISLVLV